VSIRRVALIYDDRPRPETTGVYCLRALRDLVDVEHVRPDALDGLPPGRFDLYLNVDDGLRYHLPQNLHPSAWWAIDTHLDFDWCLTKAHGFDIAFAAQRDGTVRLRDEGISTTWLPLACDPAVHAKHDLPKAHDVCFIGHVFPGPRADLLERLRRAFPDTFVGRCYFKEMARAYSAARVVFNRSVRNDVNMRVFEAVACGSVLVTNDLSDNGQAELFRDGEHLATYREADELLDKVAFYLRRGDARERIAAAGRAEALARHTYRHRMEGLLEAAERTLASVAAWTSGEVPAPAQGQATADSAAPSSRAAGAQALSPDQADDSPCDPFYFQFPRPEVVALVPPTARDVLDIGCGAGRLGEVLKARQPVTVVGVETVAAAAAEARGRLDQVLIGDIEMMDLPFAAGSFDAVVCADVLEHLAEPERLLARIRRWLRPDGRLVASLPNVRHHTVVRGLIDGHWTYEAAGLLDGTHLRFFTRRDLDRLLADTGFQIEQVQAVPGPGDGEWLRDGPPAELQLGRLHVRGLPPADMAEFLTYQHLVVAAPRPDDAESPAPEAAPQQAASPPQAPRCRASLRILYLGDFSTSWRHEALAANALEDLGNSVDRLQENLVPSPEHVLEALDRGRYDCLLFYKGRIGARTPAEQLTPTGEAIATVLAQARVPAYTWYVDRALGFDVDPSREEWMRRVAPLCRVAFVADAALAATDRARWHILREPVAAEHVQPWHVPDGERQDLAFLGQLYGPRAAELGPVEAAYPVRIIAGTYGADLSRAVRGHKVILGPRYPCVPGYWGNRLYVVLGHGGFFLAPEVEGMRDEGFVPGTHYAPLSDDPVADVCNWLRRPKTRERIARAGQALVLSRFTYSHAAFELGRMIGETLS
jgi:2-polyprenyl-3-methyl-5-hydroxy-6-metoxy-1,4-benzoquinol methylase